MTHYVGLDASKSTTSICVLNEDGETVREGVVETEPKAIIGFLRGEGRRYRRVGIESMGMTPWLYEGLAKAGLPIICIEARHAHGVLKARINKTDRNDARGIAEIMRAGIYKAVHIKTPESQHTKLLLAARKLIRSKCRDVDNMIRAALLQCGLKLAAGSPVTFERRAAALATKTGAGRQVIESLIEVRMRLDAQVKAFDAMIRTAVTDDPVCERLMTVPGVGPVTALAYRAAIDVPDRFSSSRSVGVHLGLTPRTFQSGTVDRRGRISKCGDKGARSALFLSAKAVLSRRNGWSPLQEWGRAVAAARGYMKGVVAVARQLAVLLHRVWLSGADYQLPSAAAHAE
jgi:transposase